MLAEAEQRFCKPAVESLFSLEPWLEMDGFDLELAALPVQLRIQAPDESAVMENGQHVVSEFPLCGRHVDLDTVEVVEELLGALPLPE